MTEILFWVEMAFQQTWANALSEALLPICENLHHSDGTQTQLPATTPLTRLGPLVELS